MIQIIRNGMFNKVKIKQNRFFKQTAKTKCGPINASVNICDFVELIRKFQKLTQTI